MYDFAIIGGGIVGLSTGMALGLATPMHRSESNWWSTKLAIVAILWHFTTKPKKFSKLSSAVKVVDGGILPYTLLFPMKFAASGGTETAHCSWKNSTNVSGK